MIALLLLTSIVELVYLAPTFAEDFSFIGVGDWGGAAIDTQYSKNVYAVANQMALTSTETKTKFIISTGDNFYWCGVQ